MVVPINTRENLPLPREVTLTNQRRTRALAAGTRIPVNGCKAVSFHWDPEGTITIMTEMVGGGLCLLTKCRTLA